MKSFSQAGQDDWVLSTLQGKRNGTFLDVGCHHPVEISNTFKLEKEFGWRGVGVDADIGFAGAWKKHGRRFFHADARFVDWFSLCDYYGLGAIIDYLSLDLDQHQLAVVRRFPWDRIRFSALTVEHDGYRFGNVRRDNIRSILKSHGYRMAVEDVAIAGVPFEDWWVPDNL